MRAGFQPVLAVDKDDMGLPMLCLFLAHPAECCDDDFVARLNFAGGGAVDRYVPLPLGAESAYVENRSPLVNVPDVKLARRV